MLSRWRQENFLRSRRAHFGLDALDAHETEPDDPARLVANPARLDAKRAERDARRSLHVAQAAEGRVAVEGLGVDDELRAAFADAGAEIDRLAAAVRAIAAKALLADVRAGTVRLEAERKRIMDAIRMATDNAESALARLIAPRYARAEDEARTLLREISASPADLEIHDGTLHVLVDALTAPRRSGALGGLCEDRTATETAYPGTDLRLIYSVKER
jgi:hypothetical protein